MPFSDPFFGGQLELEIPSFLANRDIENIITSIAVQGDFIEIESLDKLVFAFIQPSALANKHKISKKQQSTLFLFIVQELHDEVISDELTGALQQIEFLVFTLVPQFIKESQKLITSLKEACTSFIACVISACLVPSLATFRIVFSFSIASLRSAKSGMAGEVYFRISYSRC